MIDTNKCAHKYVYVVAFSLIIIFQGYIRVHPKLSLLMVVNYHSITNDIQILPWVVENEAKLRLHILTHALVPTIHSCVRPIYTSVLRIRSDFLSGNSTPLVIFASYGKKLTYSGTVHFPFYKSINKHKRTYS